MKDGITGHTYDFGEDQEAGSETNFSVPILIVVVVVIIALFGYLANAGFHDLTKGLAGLEHIARTVLTRRHF